MGKPAVLGEATTKNKQITISSSSNNNNKSSTKTTTACCSKVGIKRGPWTAEEDEVLSNFIRREGEGRWRTLPKRAGLLRCGKSCRLRWMNYLRPSVKRGHIAPDEEDLILRLHRLLGNRWSLIAGRIPGRTDNEIKNYWNTHLSKKLISQGIDPRTHKPLNHDDTNRPSSSKINHRMFSNPIPNSNIQTPTAEELDPTTSTAGGTQIMNNKDLQGNHIVDYPSSLGPVADFHGYENLPSSDVTKDFVLEEVHNLDCSADDVWSSFLNSFLNEDAFSSPQLPPHLSTDALGVSANAASNENNSQKVDDRVQ